MLFKKKTEKSSKQTNFRNDNIKLNKINAAFLHFVL